MDEMTRGVSRWIMPLELPTHTLNRERVLRACQALSLDEERTTFHPELWDEKIVPPSEFDPNKERHIADEQISQVWFAGPTSAAVTQMTRWPISRWSGCSTKPNAVV
jgi:hypothetical protein